MEQEEFDEKGHVTNKRITDMRTELKDVEKNGVTLVREIKYWVSGKLYLPDPKTFKEGFHGELVSQGLKVKEAGNGQVVIEGRTIPCNILRLERVGPASKTVTTIYYSTTLAPYVLKRQSVTTNLADDNSQEEKTIYVMALDMPCKVLAEIQTVAFVKTVWKHVKGTTTTWAATSEDVPGGVIWHASKELDKTGRLIRRSTLQLVDYGLEPARPGLFSRPRRGIFRLR